MHELPKQARKIRGTTGWNKFGTRVPPHRWLFQLFYLFHQIYLRFRSGGSSPNDFAHGNKDMTFRSQRERGQEMS